MTHARTLLLLCALTACGSVGGASPDAAPPSPDAAVDASIDAQPPPPSSPRAEFATASGRASSAGFELEAELGLPLDQTDARGAEHVLSSAAAVHP